MWPSTGVENFRVSGQIHSYFGPSVPLSIYSLFSLISPLFSLHPLSSLPLYLPNSSSLLFPSSHYRAIPALPSIGTMPGNRSFRPYTTYELELIRRHQKMGLPVFGPMMRFSRGPRSAGGAHTLTNSRRRVRIAPLSSAYSPEPYSSPSRVRSAHHTVKSLLIATAFWGSITM